MVQEFYEGVWMFKPPDYWRNYSAFGVPLRMPVNHQIVRCPEGCNIFIGRPSLLHECLGMRVRDLSHTKSQGSFSCGLGPLGKLG